jgi:hypothetical protein
MRRWFSRAVLSRPVPAFVVMALSFFAFGIGTVNLFRLLMANLTLLADHGLQAALDGGLAQLAELLVSGFAAMAAYAVFKACEFSVVRFLVGNPSPGGAANPRDDEQR